MSPILLNKNKFWQLHNTMLKGVFYNNIREYSTFYHYKSNFKDKFYNFIKPKISSDKLNWNEAEKIIENEAINGYEISYFINEEFNDGYKQTLKIKDYLEINSDYYPIKKIDSEFSNISGNFLKVNKDNFERYCDIVQSCFPTYSNNKQYCQFSFKEQLKNPGNFINILLEVDSKFVAFGSILMSPELGIAFLHNVGTLENYRRKGYFTELTKYLSNLAYRNGVDYVYANVENEGGSYFGFIKLGFEVIDKNYVYSKS